MESSHGIRSDGTSVQCKQNIKIGYSSLCNGISKDFHEQRGTVMYV